MKFGLKAALALLGVAAIGGAVAIAASNRKAAVPPGPVPVSAVPPGLPGAVDFNLPSGWTVFGWYTYQGKSDEKLWIRIDKGPMQSGAVLADLPWRWSIYVDRNDASGYVPLAQGEKSWTDFGFAYGSDTYREYSEDGMATEVARAASEQIDAMYGAAVGAARRPGWSRGFYGGRRVVR